MLESFIVSMHLKCGVAALLIPENTYLLEAIQKAMVVAGITELVKDNLIQIVARARDFSTECQGLKDCYIAIKDQLNRARCSNQITGC